MVVVQPFWLTVPHHSSSLADTAQGIRQATTELAAICKTMQATMQQQHVGSGSHVVAQLGRADWVAVAGPVARGAGANTAAHR